MESSDDDYEHAVTHSWKGWGQQPQKFGLEMQYPWSNHLLNGSKKIETRGYDLPPSLISTENNEVKIDILESQKGEDGVSVVPNVVHLTSQSPLKRIGWTTFTQSIRYTNRQQFEADADKHLVDPSSGYGWSDDRPMYGWVVGRCGTYSKFHNDNTIYIAKRRMRSLFQIVEKKPVILITGASGMLGRSVYRLLCQEDSVEVIGTGYTRLKVDEYNLHQLNLLDYKTTSEYLNKYQPDIIVHCAAERYPDKFQSRLNESVKLNVESTRHLAQESKRLTRDNNGKLGPYLIYISTSYVFDGGIVTKELPPYQPNTKANPINSYGQSKWDGECVVREILNNQSPGNGIIIRVPLLYGEDCTDLSESPALEMMKCFLPTNDKTSKKAIDHWALRFPTSCEDVARVLKLMIQRILDNKFPVADSSFGNTYHVASPCGTTKYELMKMQAKLLNISSSLVEERTEGNSEGPPKDSAPRPQCTQLDCSETFRALGEQIEFTTLEDGMTKALIGFPDRFIKE